MLTLNMIEELAQKGFTPFMIVDSIGFDRDGNPGLAEQTENDKYVNKIIPRSQYDRLHKHTRLNKEMRALLNYARGLCLCLNIFN